MRLPRSWSPYLAIFIVLPTTAMALVLVYGDLGRSAPPPPLPAAPCPPRHDGPVQYPTRYAADRAPAYTGGGPYRADFFEIDERDPVDAGDMAGVRAVDGRLPAKWTPPSDGGGTSRPAQAHLVVCEYLTRAGPTSRTCEYSEGRPRSPGESLLHRGRGPDGGKAVFPVRMVQGSYTYQVYQARTSELVAEFDLQGGPSCPFELAYADGDRPTTITAEVAETELHQRLRPLLEPAT